MADTFNELSAQLQVEILSLSHRTLPPFSAYQDAVFLQAALLSNKIAQGKVDSETFRSKYLYSNFQVQNLEAH